MTSPQKREGVMKPQTVREILERLLEWRNVDGKTVLGDLTIDESESALRELMEGVVPEWKPAHTYASENADIYMAYDGGFKDCQKKTITNIARLFGEKNESD